MADKKKPAQKKSPGKKKAAAKPASSERGLGRGLSALMSDLGSVDNLTRSAPPKAPETKSAKAPETKSAPISGRGVATLAIDKIVRNPDQPRRYFDKALLAELTESIRDKGVLQPILVRPVPSRDMVVSGKPVYQIVAGERRWQASLKAGLTSMPALVRELSDRDVLEIGVVENVQRADLNPIEEALAYRALVDQFSRTQEEIANAIGKSRPHIANMLRLLTLPKRAQDALQAGQISTGHARAVIAAPDPDALVEQIIEKQLSVRDAENWVRRIKAAEEDGGLSAAPPPRPEKSSDVKKIEDSLTDITGITVELNHKNPGGDIRLKYKNEEQLAMILALLGYNA